MADLLGKLELWILGAGMVLGLLAIGAAMLMDMGRRTGNDFEPGPERDEEDRDQERQEAELPLG